jgi:hypothetical protein
MDTGTVSGIYGLVGAAIGGAASLLATKWANAHQLKLQQQIHETRIQGVLRAIRYELEVLRRFYDENAGKLLGTLKEGEPVWFRFVLTEKYFLVYPSNIALVAQIDDPDLCRCIVEIYNGANLLIEMFRINNLYIDQQEECERLSRDGTESKYVIKGRWLLSLQIEHAQSIRKADAALKSATNVLLARIEAYLDRRKDQTSSGQNTGPSVPHLNI